MRESFLLKIQRRESIDVLVYLLWYGKHAAVRWVLFFLFHSKKMREVCKVSSEYSQVKDIAQPNLSGGKASGKLLEHESLLAIPDLLDARSKKKS